MHLPKERSSRIKLAVALAAAVGAYLLFKAVVPDFDPQEVLEDVSGTLGAWTYLLVGLLAFLETGAFVGLVAPGETFVVLAGAVAGQGETDVLLTIAIVWFSAFMGDTVSYLLGAKLGRNFVLRHGERVRITQERFAQVERYFDRHGGKTILVGRFIGLVRALAPFIAGSSKMPYRAMAPYSILGTGLWSTTFTLLGYFASQNIDAVLSASHTALLGFAIFVGAVVGVVMVIRHLREPENRSRLVARMERRPVLRSLVGLGRRVAPEARFLWRRLTPGDLGLELTAPFAVLAVSSYVFIAYAIVVGDAPGATGADSAAADIAADLRAGWLTSVNEVVTALGSTLAFGVVAAVAAVVLAVRRHWSELAILLFGVAAILIAVPEVKDAIERPRPEGGLVGAEGFAYPSGHAAHSVIYAWLAVVGALRLRSGWSGGTALITAGLVLAAAVGLSRVYLGVHYWSDVSGGWGLGVSLFAIATIVAVIVSHIRQNRVREA